MRWLMILLGLARPFTIKSRKYSLYFLTGACPLPMVIPLSKNSAIEKGKIPCFAAPGKTTLTRHISASRHRVAVGVDLVDFAQVQLTNARLHFAHVSYAHPYQMVRQDVFLSNLIRTFRRYGQRFLCEGVVVVLRQAIFEDVAISAAELLYGFKSARQRESRVGLLILEFFFRDRFSALHFNVTQNPNAIWVAQQ